MNLDFQNDYKTPEYPIRNIFWNSIVVIWNLWYTDLFTFAAFCHFNKKDIVTREPRYVLETGESVAHKFVNVRNQMPLSDKKSVLKDCLTV